MQQQSEGNRECGWFDCGSNQRTPAKTGDAIVAVLRGVIVKTSDLIAIYDGD